jgi:coenzyme Q-binding protein COQ10
MPKFEHSSETNYSMKQIYDLVLDVEKYPEFLPWCGGARVIADEEDYKDAELIISYKGIVESYRSRITFSYTPDTATIEANLISGPFKSLSNVWVIKRQGQKTIINFFLTFELKVGFLSKMLTPFFTRACDKMLSAFETRATELYGN